LIFPRRAHDFPTAPREIFLRTKQTSRNYVVEEGYAEARPQYAEILFLTMTGS
jgi:hypothetical protein